MPVMKSAPKGDANRHNKLAAKWSRLRGVQEIRAAHGNRQVLMLTARAF